ncbi:hypothetical protein [Gluconobacter kondonii]|uniref:hypothetical protein n=1 Tax=Gluconobacter kondonii TaxID=941463 RepID=UPI001B8D7073|nr:hypothetical protein [Gluconobacter kondonii]MBS1082345.1 hypothetical protein [Gluconobacter kondonii]
MPQFVPFDPMPPAPKKRPYYIAFLVLCAIMIGNLPGPFQILGLPMLLVVCIPPARRWVERMCRKVWLAWRNR